MKPELNDHSFVELVRDTTADIPVPQSHKAELDARAARHTKFPHEVLTLDELIQGIDRQK
jgi:hypothetical protein